MIARLLSFLLFGAVALSGQKQSELPKPQQLLRSRAEGYYTALVESRWKRVESFLNEDAKVLWAQSKKTAVYSYKILSVEVALGGKEGTTEATVEYPTEGMLFPGRSFKITQKQQWVWENDDWFVVWRLKPPPEPKRVIEPEPADPNAASDLTFDPPEIFDYRLIRRGDLIKAKFSYTNTSDHIVKLRAAVLDLCHCITVKVSKSEVKPGEGGTIEMTMDSSQFAGVVTQSIVVEMEPSHAKRVLSIEGTIFIPAQKGTEPKHL